MTDMERFERNGRVPLEAYLAVLEARIPDDGRFDPFLSRDIDMAVSRRDSISEKVGETCGGMRHEQR